MHLSKFVHSETGKIVMSILLGLGLATIFKRACKGRNCIVYKIPKDMNDDDIYKQDGKCYRVKSDAVTCDKSKPMVS